MQISGVITSYEEKPNTLRYTLAPDDGEKHEDLYANTPEMQKLVKSLVHKHVTIEYEQGMPKRNSKEFWKNVGSITESEAPKQNLEQLVKNASQELVKTFNSQPQQTRENSIETQVAVKAVIELLTTNTPIDEILAADTLAWIRARIPSSVPTAPEKAPEPSVVKANKAQIANLKKYVKVKNDGELLAQACYRANADLKNLEDIPEDIAMEWLNEVMKK